MLDQVRCGEGAAKGGRKILIFIRMTVPSVRAFGRDGGRLV